MHSEDHPQPDTNPAAGDLVVYQWQCPYCVSGEWEDGTACRHCDGRGMTNDTRGANGSLVRSPRPPAVRDAQCGGCRYEPTTGGAPHEPTWCHEDMPSGANNTMSPAVWYGGMPLGYTLCTQWWEAVTHDPVPPPRGSETPA